MDTLFKIYKINNKEVDAIQQSDNTPHKHDFEELIIGLKGKLSHFIDYNHQEIEAPFISFVTKGKIHRVEPKLVNGVCDFWVIRFKSELIPEVTFQLYNYYHDQANFQLHNDKYLERLDTMCQLLHNESQEPQPELAIIKNLLSTLFKMIEIEREKTYKDRTTVTLNQDSTFQSFLAILEDNFRRPMDVSFYAEKLFMTSRSLNAITQHILQQTVSEVIETRKLIEAKNLLYATDKNVAEIGYELGYSDKAYFTSVFKKKSGITPTQFRQEMQRKSQNLY